MDEIYCPRCGSNNIYTNGFDPEAVCGECKLHFDLDETTGDPPPDLPETYTAAFAFVEVMHNRLKWQSWRDCDGRPIDNVNDLVNCLNNGSFDPVQFRRSVAS